MTSAISTEYMLPDEPTRFTPRDMDRLLLHCTLKGASDITMQTNSPVLTEVHGRLYPVTQPKISQTEVSEMINAIYGPNGTTQLSSGRDVDTHYEIRPDRSTRYRFRVNGTACQVEGHDAIQITCRTIAGEPPLLSTMNLDKTLLEHIAPLQGTVVVTGSTGSGKSTLLASIIREIASQLDANRKILCYED